MVLYYYYYYYYCDAYRFAFDKQIIIIPKLILKLSEEVINEATLPVQESDQFHGQTNNAMETFLEYKSLKTRIWYKSAYSDFVTHTTATISVC